MWQNIVLNIFSIREYIFLVKIPLYTIFFWTNCQKRYIIYKGLGATKKYIENQVKNMKIFELPTQKIAIVKKVYHPSEQMQQRLYDLGIYPGGKVKLVLISPKGDPKAYEVRGTVIALRNEDAQYIEVELGDEINGK